MGRVKVYHPRSRKGCATCKTRRVKCDETVPVCVRCSKLGVKCVYEATKLMWEDEADRRGITFGRSAEARSRRQNESAPTTVQINNVVLKREHYQFINVSSADFESLIRDERINSNSARSDFFQEIYERTLTPTLDSVRRYGAFDFSVQPLTFDDIFTESFAAFPVSHVLNTPDLDVGQSKLVLQQHERELITYFIKSIGPYCVCCEVSSNSALNGYIAPELNPYLHLIVPLSFRSPLVMKTLVAASATQLVLIGNTQYQGIAQRYLVEVIGEIPQLIESRRNQTDWDEVFAVIIMLCFIEISANCNNSWLTLLNYAKGVLRESSCIRQDKLSPLGKFFIRYFISHEVMGETAWVHDYNSTFTTVLDDPFIEEKRDRDLKIDLVFGCSPYLISLINRITVVGQCQDHLELETTDKDLYMAEILRHTKETEKMLRCMKQQLPNNSELYFSDEEMRNISIVAEIKRLGALLYLFAVVYRNSTLELHTRFEPHMCTDRLIELQRALPDCYMSLLWPLFVVGLTSADDEETRWFVLDCMRQMEKRRKLKTVEAAREILVNVWKEKDLGAVPLHWKDMMRGRTTTISLA